MSTTFAATHRSPSPALVEDAILHAGARDALKAQIARIEAATVGLVAEAHPLALDLAPLQPGPPRLMSLGQLESRRDALALRLEDARAQLTTVRSRQDDARVQIELMLSDPKSYRWLRVSRDDLGLPGCGHWHVRPRLGLIGMLAGWWHVKISSGCPLICDSGKRRALTVL
ncbi:MAG: hypothetical protein NTX07_08065 [Solirubrobacterales bacterium]|nr:hypothetical protein [Solirubrobacterales bacterium]